MLRISDALDTIIKDSSFFQAGLGHRLFNLSQLADFLHPLVEARLKRQVQRGALVMNLSRLQKRMQKVSEFLAEVVIQKLTIQANLYTATFPHTHEVRKAVHQFQKTVYGHRGFINVTEGQREITLIVEQGFLEEMPQYIPQKPSNVTTNITGIGLQFGTEFSEQPGFLYQILQKIALQNLNVVELFSTYSEFMLFFDHAEAKLAMETLYNCFRIQKA